MVSIVSRWELVIKHQIGQLDLSTTDVGGDFVKQGFSPLSIAPVHLVALAGQYMLHPDPFDHLLLALAKAEGMTIVTTDQIFSEYLADVWIV